jgi:hypothetical protein
MSRGPAFTFQAAAWLLHEELLIGIVERGGDDAEREIAPLPALTRA